MLCMHMMALHIIKRSKFKHFVLKRFKMKLMAFIESNKPSCVFFFLSKLTKYLAKFIVVQLSR